jgi:hypothetical protein
VIKSPNPLCYEGFLGCKHFSKTNAILEKEGQQPIDWRLDDWSPQPSEKTSTENQDSITQLTTSSSPSPNKVDQNKTSNANKNEKEKSSTKETNPKK